MSPFAPRKFASRTTYTSESTWIDAFHTVPKTCRGESTRHPDFRGAKGDNEYVLSGSGHAVRPKDRIHHGVVLLPAKDQSMPEDSFPDGSNFLGDALAGDVFTGGLDLEA